jgi:hypothetical protein
MTSSAQRGSYYKARTKRWLESKGYQVADLEKMHWIFANRGGRSEPMIPVKRDQFGSDLLAVSARSVIFVQVKGASAARGNFPDARRRFATFQFPPWTRQWVIAWPARSRVPRIVEMKREADGETHVSVYRPEAGTADEACTDA